MIPGYAYVGMLVTGGLHCFIGVAATITAIVGLAIGPYIRNYFMGALFAGFWICFVGIIGIAAGIKKFADETTRQLKIAYMVTAILSACIFSGLAIGMYTASITTYFGHMRYHYHIIHDYYTIGWFGIIICIVEFFVAIVSSSICCCCSRTTQNTTVIIQALPDQIVTTMHGQTTTQYQSPPNNTIQYQQPLNKIMQYQTSGDGAVGTQPPAYEQHAYPTKSQEET